MEKKPTLRVTLTFRDEKHKQQFIEAAKKENRSIASYCLNKAAPVIFMLIGLSGYSQDTICLPKRTYIEIYKGLKAEEYYRQANADCIEIANSLNTIIQQQNDSLQISMSRLDEVNYELDYLNYQYQEAIKSRLVPWYKSPWFWSGVGLFTGLILGGQ